jgi:hypothetical protein
MRRFLFPSTLLTAALATGTAGARCQHEAEGTQLDTLRVHTCLWAEPRAASETPGVTELRETVTNIGTETIVLELHRDPLLRFRVGIYRGAEDLAIAPPPPTLHGPPDRWAQGREMITLAPAQSITLSVAIARLMTQPPEREAFYRISVAHSYPWRRPDEPEGQAFRLRLEEATRKRAFPETSWFEAVRLD